MSSPLEGRDARLVSLLDTYGFSPLGREIVGNAIASAAINRKDYDVARAWLLSSDLKQSPLAQYQLGLMQIAGLGVPQQTGDGMARLKAAAEAGLYDAQLRLGQLYLHGGVPGLTVDRDQAKFWALKAGTEGRTDGMALLTELSLSAADVKPTMGDADRALTRSIQDAIQILQQLAQHGDGAASYWLGELVIGGRGAKQDPALGRNLVASAARLGIAPAIDQIAQMTFDGDGAPSNPVEAIALAYVAQDDVVWNFEKRIADDTVNAFLPALTPPQFQDVRELLNGVRNVDPNQAK